MKIMGIIAGRTLTDRERNENLRPTCWIDNINDWILDKKIEWNEYIDRMTEERFVRIDKSLAGRRSFEKPRKRWSDNLSNGRARQWREYEQAMLLYTLYCM